MGFFYSTTWRKNFRKKFCAQSDIIQGSMPRTSIVWVKLKAVNFMQICNLTCNFYLPKYGICWSKVAKKSKKNRILDFLTNSNPYMGNRLSHRKNCKTKIAGLQKFCSSAKRDGEEKRELGLYLLPFKSYCWKTSILWENKL